MIAMPQAISLIYSGVDFTLTAPCFSDEDKEGLTKRQEKVIHILKGSSHMTSNTMCLRMGACRNTARKELVFLCNQGEIKVRRRIVGGHEQNEYFI